MIQIGTYLTVVMSAFFLWQMLASNATLALMVAAIGAGIVVFRYLTLKRRQERLPVNPVASEWLRSRSIIATAPAIREHLRGHDAVVTRVCRQIESGLQLGDPNRSLGSFMLVGPTGTGKTYLARLVAKALYPEHEPVTIPMNQYKDRSDVGTLLASLLDPVKTSPYRVIILDEIEKAHRDIIHSLYDILDCGYVTDRRTGDIVTFEGCVFFATCNAGIEELRAIANQGVSESAWNGRAREALSGATEFERPFLARWDEVFLMDTLSPKQIAEVACQSITSFWSQRGIRVSFASPALLATLLKLNEDFKQYGVRQLQQLIRMKSDAAVLQAKKMGYHSVTLEIDNDDEFVARKTG